MTLLILTAIITVAVAVASIPLNEPWKVDKKYIYNVESFTWTTYEQSDSNGNAFKAQFIIRVLEPGHLLAKLENTLYAQVQGQLSKDALPTDLNYQPVQNMDHAFEIFVEGGRVLSIEIVASLPLYYENLIKGLISALQVDLSPYNHVENFPNIYDDETFQGLFKKMETDVTGNCETLYVVSPVSTGWHRELPDFAEDPLEVIKSRNYGSCLDSADYHFGVPEGAVWKGVADDNEEVEFIQHSSESRLLVSKQGTIYKSETLSSVLANPLLFGKQKAEVYSYIRINLASVIDKTEEFRKVDSLLYTLTEEPFIQIGKDIANVYKLLREMSTLIQDPNNLPKTDFLSKFNVLVRLIASMNSEQITHMTNSVEAARTSRDVTENSMWKIYRDAVAQSGTVVAFKEIKAWILNKKIEGGDAALVMSSMASVLRHPTREIMYEFYDFVMSPEVLEEKFLNTTALLAVTKFIRLSGDEFLVKDTVSCLSQELKWAIEIGNGTKAQVFIRVLGNLAHPNILEVFAPYLQGKKEVSKYLRAQMVISLKSLANSRDPFVRAVLFSLLKNTAEPYEVRVAAALNIFLAYPTPEMMQIMAHMTNDDPSIQVRAVLAHSISFAAGLKDPRFAPLAKPAKAVLYLVSKENFGYRYSTDSLIEEYTSDDEIAYFREVSYIGSENSVLPVYHRGALRFRSTGWTEEDWFTFSVSDVQHLIDTVTGLVFERSENVTGYKFTPEKISEILNITWKQRDSLEGSFFLDNWNQQLLLTFNEDDLNLLMKECIKQRELLLSGVESYYTKILFQKQVFVIFPLAIGMPFMFAYNEPTAFIIRSNIKAKMNQNMSDVSTKNELQLAYARNLDSSVGYFDTLGDVYASAGVINKLQFFIPAKFNTDLKIGDLKLKIEFPEQNVNLIHMSVWPYTTVQKIDSLLTVAENPLTKFIERPAKVISTNYKFGLLTGFVFELEGYSYSNGYKNPNSFLNADILTNVRNLLYQKDVALTEFNLKFLASESQNKDVTCNVYYDTIFYQTLEKGPIGPASIMNDISAEARRKEIVERVVGEIFQATVLLLDISVVLDGKQKGEYIFTGAYAYNYDDVREQAAVFIKGSDQINAMFNVTKPKISLLNFNEVLKHKLKLLYEADIKFGNSENVHFSGFGERSEMYTEMLLNDPLAKKCLQEISEKNFYQKACHMMILKANAPDYFKGVLTYKDFGSLDLNMTYNFYKFYNKIMNNKIYTWEKREDLSKTVDEGTMQIEAQAYYYDNYINYELTTKSEVLRMNNVTGKPYYPYAMSLYPVINNWERISNWYSNFQNLPFCTVDDNKILTFSGRSYNFTLPNTWHLVMVDDGQKLGTKLVILAKRDDYFGVEFYVTYQTPTGRIMELELQPRLQKADFKQFDHIPFSIFYNLNEDGPLLDDYCPYRGDWDEIKEYVYVIHYGAIRIVIDKRRLVIFTDDHRSVTRGLCGQGTTEPNDDYMTPHGLIDLPEYYAASFALEDGDNNANITELKKGANLKAYQPVIKYTNILSSDSEWAKTKSKHL